MISIIILVYNTEKYLDECLRAVTAQTYNDLEVILVNDGSRDGSAEICKKWQKRDERILFINQDNLGASAARNRGIEKAKGEFILFVDSDDVIETRYVEVLYSLLLEYNVDLACANYEEFSELNIEKTSR